MYKVNGRPFSTTRKQLTLLKSIVVGYDVCLLLLFLFLWLLLINSVILIDIPFLCTSSVIVMFYSISAFFLKPFKLSGRVQKLNLQPETEKLKYALFAFCTPARTSMSVLEIRMKTTLFCSKNRIDLSFLDLDAR